LYLVQPTVRQLLIDGSLIPCLTHVEVFLTFLACFIFVDGGEEAIVNACS